MDKLLSTGVFGACLLGALGAPRDLPSLQTVPFGQTTELDAVTGRLAALEAEWISAAGSLAAAVENLQQSARASDVQTVTPGPTVLVAAPAAYGSAGNGTAAYGSAGNGTAAYGSAGNGTAVYGSAGNGTAAYSSAPRRSWTRARGRTRWAARRNY